MKILRLLIITAVAGICLLSGKAQAAAIVPGRPSLSAASAGQEDIRDIRPPYHIPPAWLWLAWTAGGLALAALGWGAWRWRHRLGLRVKLPYELALEQLEEARRLMQPEQARAFSFAVSEIVRNYIEQCLSVRAAHRTTEEFLRDMATRPDSPLAAHQPALTEFMRHCDLAKFARWILSAERMEAMWQSARDFIVATGNPIRENSTVRSADASPASVAAAPMAANFNPHTL